MPHHVYTTFLAKLNSPEGKFEAKGRCFWGIDITTGPGGYRSLFCMNDRRQPVLCFLGHHDQYDEVLRLIRFSPESTRSRFIDDLDQEKITAPAITVTQCRFLKAMTGHDVASSIPLQAMEP